MVINTNVSALSSSRLLAQSSSMLEKSLARLSSGSKLVNPEDDAAGLAVSMRFDAQINRTSATKANVGNAISFNQTRDGFLQKVQSALDRMSELSILAQDVTKGPNDLLLYDAEFQQLSEYLTSAGDKDFNGVSLFSGNVLNVTIDSEGNTFDMQGIDLLGNPLYAAVTSSDVTTSANALLALTAVKNAINELAGQRATMGAYQVRLNFSSEQITVSKENLSAASSRIQDVDVAEESTAFARYNILVQSGTAMLAQANQVPQSALRLLQ